jgi:hypothetical protein
MSLRDDRRRPDQGYDRQGSPFASLPVGANDQSPDREAKRYPGIIVMRHLKPPCTGGDNGAERVSRAERVVPNLELVVPSPVRREEQMHDLGSELQSVVRRAAGPVSAGMSIKSQINSACDNLGYPRGHWRVKNAWHGYAANWNAKAVFDLLDRYNRYMRKHGIIADATAETHASANDPITILSKVGEQRRDFKI